MPEATRRLVAIMFTDIAGYTALMGEDEDRAVRALHTCRAVVRAQVEKAGGTVLEEIGDGTLASFDSAVGAVECAREIQRQVASDPDYELRIGIHIGDVLVSGSQVMGDGVNVASRIHGLAEPGHICLSDRVYDDVRNHPEFQPSLLGERELKNVNRLVTVYVIGSDGQGVAPAAPLKPPSRRRWVWAAAAAVLVAGLFATGLHRRIAVAALVNLPVVLADDLDQQIGFATTEDGTRIAYAVTGEGPAVVRVLTWFSHVERGLASPVYSPTAARWAERFTYVRYDGRGTGLSDRDVDDFAVATRRSDLEAVIDTLGLEKVSLLGFSAGGPVAISYAVEHPERVHRLVLIGTGANGDKLRAANPMIERLPDLFRAGWSQDSAAARHMVSSIIAPEATPVQSAFIHELLGQSMDGETAARFFGQITGAGTTIEDLLPRVTVPTLILHAQGDLLVPVEAGGRELAARIPGSRLIVLESNNHGIPPGDSAFEPMMAEIEAFLTN